MYQPYYQPFQQQQMPDFLRSQYQQAPQQQSTDERIWVSSPAAADAYLMAPNSFVRLWDSSRPVFYEYSRKDMQAQEKAPATDYTDRLKSIEERLSALERSRNESDEQPDADAK